MTWIFEDTATASPTDRQALLDYLVQHNIALAGYSQEARQDDEGWVWRYPAYAVKRFASDQTLELKLQEKLKLWCSERGGGEDQQLKQNDIERNYQNVSAEFHALYVLTALMGYQCVGWDPPCGKQGVNPQKNCDFALTKDGKTIFADAKDCSSAILSQGERESVFIDGERVSTAPYSPKVELVEWLKGQVHEGDKQGADLLVCHLPGWGLRGLAPRELRRYLDKILPKALTWTEHGPHWGMSSNWVKQIIIVKHMMGCFVIELGGVNAIRHQY